jgi:hypothetical protein
MGIFKRTAMCYKTLQLSFVSATISKIHPHTQGLAGKDVDLAQWGGACLKKQRQVYSIDNPVEGPAEIDPMMNWGSGKCQQACGHTTANQQYDELAKSRWRPCQYCHLLPMLI